MQIGDIDLELSKPQKLDEQLVRMTGCTAREIHANLAHAAIADHVAAALLPFLKEPPARHVLAQAIADSGVAEIRGKVRCLYADELGIAPEPEPAPLKGKRRGRAQG